MSGQNNKIVKKEFDLVSIISTVIQIPGVKVDREAFLKKKFEAFPEDDLNRIVNEGPVEAGITRETLGKMSRRIVAFYTTEATAVSFLAGLPGGLFAAISIPADLAQYYAVTLRMAQEIAYLYGEKDMWCDGTPDYEKVQNRLIVYCGVMFGVDAAKAGLRIMAGALAKQAVKKIPQMALMKGAWYPIVKSVCKFFGVHMNKTIMGNAIGKAIPIVGGVVGGGLTLATMIPMGNNLVKTLDKAHFDYTQKDFDNDVKIVTSIMEEESKPKEKKKLWGNKKSKKNGLEEIREAKQMLDEGLLT